MTSRQYKLWIEKFFPEALANKFFKKIIDLKNLKIKGVEDEVESSFNSVDSFNLIKVTHILRIKDKKTPMLKPINFIKVKKFINFIAEINNELKLRFDLKILKKILNFSIIPIRETKAFVLTFDFKQEKLIKLSVAFNIKNLKDLFKIFSRNFSILPKIKKKNLLYFVVDFFPNEKKQLKIYYSYHPFRSTQFFQKIINVKIFNPLLREVPPNEIIKMEKITFQNKLSLGGIYLCYYTYVKINKFLKIEFLTKKYPFLNQVYSLIKNFRISFFSLKPKNMIEIYFR